MLCPDFYFLSTYCFSILISCVLILQTILFGAKLSNEYNSQIHDIGIGWTGYE
jgi:hypothetical protein